jgi:DNA-binding IclR family transcriptional regulator
MADAARGEETSNFDIQSVSRVGQILALYGPQTDELTAADVAVRLGMNRTTAYRYCTSLVAAGILERGRGRGAFALGALLLQLGVQAVGRHRVMDVAPPHLAQLSSDVGATAVLSLWGGNCPIVALVQEDLSSTVLVTVRAGSRLDLGSAQMRVFLAYLPDAQLVERATAGLGDVVRAEVEAAVYTTRRNGYSTVNLEDGLFSAAAPVFDERGICATIALLGGDRLAGFPSGSAPLARLRQTAASLSELLGGGEGADRADVR